MEEMVWIRRGEALRLALGLVLVDAVQQRPDVTRAQRELVVALRGPPPRGHRT